MKSKKKYNRNKKVNPYTLEQFRLGGFNGFGIDPSTNNVPMPSNVPVGGSIPEIPVDPIAGGGMPGTMPYQAIADVGVQGIEAVAKNDNMYGQEIDSQGESVGKGALTGAGTGAALGTMIMPGIGTAIGAVGGAIVGAVGGGMKNKKQRENIQAPLADMSGNVSQNPYGTPSFKDGGIPSYPDGGLTPGMTGMMKSKIAYADAFGNKAGERMVSPNPKTYDFGDGTTGTHYMSSYGNYAIPQLQDTGGENLQFFANKPPMGEAIKFDRPEDAEYFAKNYKDVAPMMRSEKFKGGGIPNNPMINIEKGELNVDLESGDILNDYDTHQFKPHSKGKNKEHLGNFVEASQNGVVIPKKWRDEYMKNKDARKGIIRNVLNNQIDRELYGKDADGNTKSFAKMKAGGVQQYIFGGVNGDPLRSPMDLRENNPEFDNIFSSYNQGQDPMYQNRNTANENPLYNFQNVNYPQKNQYPTTSYNPADPLPENLPQFNTDKNFLGIMNNNDPASAPNFQSGPTSSRSNPQFVDSNAERLFNRQDRKDNNLWTTGNTIGAAGNVLGAVGPLAVTLANGIDRDEINEFANVEGAAINELSGIHRRGKENTFNNIKRQSNIASNMNRNSTSSFATLSARQQAVTDATQRNLREAGLGYDTNEANTTSQLRFQGDMRDAAGRQDRSNKLDQNIDNFFNNLSSNFTNAANMTQGFGKNVNKHKENQAKLKGLQQMSPDFDINAKGEFTFKGKVVNV